MDPNRVGMELVKPPTFIYGVVLVISTMKIKKSSTPNPNQQMSPSPRTRRSGPLNIADTAAASLFCLVSGV